MAEYAECNSRRNKDQCKRGHGLEELAKRFQRPGAPVILLAYTGEKLESFTIRLMKTVISGL